jgi:4-amino-4-deoxy-L-arabinose transferase-like glycosyltransferase
MESMPLAGQSDRSILTWLEDHYQLTVLAIAALIFFGAILSPPSLMDDVDAVHAAIARTMLRSGDWVTARINGVTYLDKAPMTYWLIAASYAVFGVHDWAARIPCALSAVLLCWVTARFGAWAFSRKAGFYAGLTLGASAGLFLFTRILIPEVILTLAVTLALWSFLRLLDEDETRRGLWGVMLGASLGAGLLLKGLLGVVAPAGAGLLYLLVTRQMFSRDVWRRLRPVRCLALALLIAAPWYVLATLANPPYFDFTLRSEPGVYRGFFWRYFINEHLLRYLGLRHPRDYNTVPRLQFWLLHLVWLFPWSVYFPAAARLSYRPADRAGRTRLLALCWCGFLLVFFTFSTTQEYYTVPIYPALALLIGSAVAEGGAWVRRGTRTVSVIAAAAALAAGVILFLVRVLPAAGDITSALSQNPEAYTLSLGHLSDLRLASFAYLRLPLLLTVIAFGIGAVGSWMLVNRGAWLTLALMMLLFFHAARLAMVVFDPYLSSRPLAEALRYAPRGRLIVEGAYYPFSSVFFYADREGFLLNGRFNNLEYGSYASGAPPVFIDDGAAKMLWSSSNRYYLLSAQEVVPRLQRLLGDDALHAVLKSGGKALYSNQPLM